MTMETASRGYTQNFRKFRRYLQGKGVNLRETIVSVDAYADARITVPGLHDDDAIISVLNLTDMLDVTGYLDDGGEAASHEYGSSDLRFTLTARKTGLGGNKIAMKSVTGTGVSSPLSVAIGPRDALFGETGHPGWTGILVTLATNGAGTLDTTDPNGANSAKNVVEAILDAQESPAQEAIVDAAIKNGNGEDPVGVIAATALTGGTAFKQGPSTAGLLTSFTDPYLDGNVRYRAVQPGAEGNDITVAYTAGVTLGVVVTDDAIVVTYVVGVTTAKDVVDAVNANADAALLVIASLASVDATDGLVETLAQTNLSGGADPGIQFSAATDTPLGAKSLKVLWLTRDERDEDPRA